MEPGLFSLLPIVVAIGLALLTRQVLLALFCGLLTAALLVNGGAPWAALLHTIDPWLLDALADRDHMKVTLFSLFVAATIAVSSRSGGTEALVALITRQAKTRRSGMVATWAAGQVVFFDDYANCLVVGTSMRPVADRLKISREKLAYLVDSTAAPVATVALISTWVGFEVGLMDEALRESGLSMSAYAFFLEGLPYRFYPLLALVFGFFISVSGRDFGPMAAAESATLARPAAETAEPPAMIISLLAILPITALVAVTGASLWTQGSAATPADAPLFEIIGAADGYDAMLHGSTVSLLLAAVLAVGSRRLTMAETSRALIEGMTELFEALAVLMLAWALGSAIKELGAAEFLLSAMGSSLPPWSLPSITFILAAAIAFATGTSFGTMTVLMPLALPMALGMESPPGFIALATSASVLSGSVWGDHCSPISDTTVLSSTGSGCDHDAHVKTQMPYAIVVGIIAVLLGTLPAGFGVPWYILLPLGTAACAAAVWGLGRLPTSSSPSPTSAPIDSDPSSHPALP